MNIENKFERYLELSLKFKKEVKDIIHDIPVIRDHAVYITDNGYHTLSNSCCDKEEEKVPPTRSELILEKAKEQAELSDEYDEFLQLGRDLQDYFKATNKLTDE